MSAILIVEDEQHLADGLRFNLEAEGHIASVADTGELALDFLSRHSVDLVLLDVMLPGIDGFGVVTELRARQQFVPVLMLTARGRAEDVLQGFAAGADDYLSKPFELSILMARVTSLLRRAQWLRPEQPPPLVDRFEFDGRSIDFAAMEIQWGENRFPLTLMESNLLRYLVEREGKTVSRKAILEEVWNVHEDTDTRAIDNFVVRLRKYLEDDPAEPRYVTTARGVGYRFQTSSRPARGG